MYVLKSTRQVVVQPQPESPEPSLGTLFAARPLECLAPGRAAFWEGDAAEHVFRIEEGMVRIQRILLDGRRAVAGFLGAGDVMGLCFEETYLYTAEAVTPARLRRAPRAAVHALLAGSPEARPLILAQVRDEICAAQEQLLVLLHQTADERLARFLVGMARRRAGEPRPGLAVVLPMSRLDIADHLGLSVETVCRSMTKLRNEGVVHLHGPSRVVIERADVLLERAGELPA